MGQITSCAPGAERQRRAELSDAPAEQLQARLAALSALFFQFGIYVGTAELREEIPFTAQLIFASAILIQLGLQQRVARVTDPTPRPNQAGVALRAFIWATAGGILYLLIMVGAVLLFALPGKFGGLAPWANSALVLLGGALGVAGGLLANFALGAYHLAKILPGHPHHRRTPARDAARVFRASGTRGSPPLAGRDRAPP